MFEKFDDLIVLKNMQCNILQIIGVHHNNEQFKSQSFLLLWRIYL